MANLIGHEGPGSLLSLLKKKDLCTSSYADYYSSSGFGFFRIEFTLTEEAVNRMDTAIDEIITLTFQVSTDSSEELYSQISVAIN